MVCTEEVDARTNTWIEGAGAVPIYWVDGGWENRPTLLANSYYAFFSDQWIETGWGAIVTGNSHYFQEATSAPRDRELPGEDDPPPLAGVSQRTTAHQMWTGCDASGFAHSELHMGTTSSMGMVTMGDASIPESGPQTKAPFITPLGSPDPSDFEFPEDVDFLSAEIDEPHRFYAMSPVLTVVKFAEE